MHERQRAPVEMDLGFLVSFDKPDAFIGRAALEAEKAASRAKIVKADKEVGKLQKLVGDVLVEQTPSMANGECSNGL